MNNINIERCVGGWKVLSKNDMVETGSFVSADISMITGYIMAKLEALD